MGIGITAHGVLSRGLLSGHWNRDRQLVGQDFRGFSPRFQGDNLDRNLDLVDALRAIAEAKGVSVAQIAIAWVAAQGEDIVPLVGARRHGTTLTCEAADADPRLPRQDGESEADDESGRGMGLVALLAKGNRVARTAGGKTVWFALAAV